ncbi:MAG: Gfo/Idh/MocA family oxidoreductase [Luteolibacter sp.]|uniref:Gfo/Idh/MocA family protein n=1 Tax=Luteolibacter sp. TaxID=1962973 RepID=UPI0032662887
MNPFSRRHFIQLGAAATLAPFINARGQDAPGKKLGVALLGLGDYATHQLGPALKQTTNAKLVGIITGSPAKIPVWQKEYEIPDGNIYNYENFDTIADNKDIDVVYVVTPTALHPEFAIRAAKAGKHVICEKPMAPTAADCQRMIDASKAVGKTLQIGYRLHWDPYHLRLMEIMKKKEFGDWKSISTRNASVMKTFTDLNAWRISKKLGVAGSLYDLGVYCVQASLYTAGMNPVSVTAKHSTKRTEVFTEVPETYEWVLEFPDGRKADGFSSYGDEGNHVRAEVEKGRVELTPAYWYAGIKGTTPDGPMNFPAVNQQAKQIDGQCAAILAGTPSMVPGEMGCRDIQVVNGIIEAAETGKPFTFGKFPY